MPEETIPIKIYEWKNLLSDIYRFVVHNPIIYYSDEKKIEKERKKRKNCLTCCRRHLPTCNPFWLRISYFLNFSSFKIVPWLNLSVAARFGECRRKKNKNMPESARQRWDQGTTDVFSIHFLRLREKKQRKKYRSKMVSFLEAIIWTEFPFSKILEKPRAIINRLHFWIQNIVCICLAKCRSIFNARESCNFLSSMCHCVALNAF